MVFLSVMAGVIVGGGVLYAARFVHRQYLDLCALRVWATAVQREAEAARAAHIPDTTKPTT